MPSAGAPPITRENTPMTPDSYQCQACGHVVAALVDDGELCIRCDAFHYPLPIVASTW